MDELTENIAREYRSKRSQAIRALPSSSDRNPDFLRAARAVIGFAEAAEEVRQIFVARCKSLGYICDCWRRRHMGTWQLGNKHKSCAEDDNYIHAYPETPCPNCNKLLPEFNKNE